MRTPFQLVAILIAIVSTMGLAVLSAVTKQDATALLRVDDWEPSSAFVAQRRNIGPLGTLKSIQQSPDLISWRSWEPQQGGRVGRLSSKPFDISGARYIAVPYSGFPEASKGAEIFLECASDKSRLDISRRRTNTDWATAFLDTRGFCDGEVRLIAQTNSKDFLVAVATPFSISASTYIIHTNPALRIVSVLATWFMLALLGAAFVVTIPAPERAPPIYLLTAAFVGVGATAMIALACFTVDARLGKASTLAAVALAAAIVWRARASERYQRLAELRGSALLWLGAALVMTSYVWLAGDDGGSWSINGIFAPLRWSTDNQLPFLFAEAIYRQAPPETITWGPWLATDRGPLMAALLAMVRVLVAPVAALGGPALMPHVYMAAGITILASWVALVPVMLRMSGATQFATALTLLIFSPFFIFNSLYTWPKILGGIYVVLSLLLLWWLRRDAMRCTPALVMVACSAAFAYLSHGSNVLGLLPVAIAFAATILRQGPRAIVAACVAAVLVASPWLYWKKVLQPNGNALERYALTREFGWDRRTDPILPEMISKYRNLGVAGWVDSKKEALVFNLGFGRDWRNLPDVLPQAGGRSDPFKSSRVLDFYLPTRTLGASIAVGLLSIVFLSSIAPRLRAYWVKDMSSVPAITAIIGAGGLLASTLLSLAAPVTHHHPYGSLMLLGFAGAAAVQVAPAVVRYALLAFSLAYAAAVWLVPPLLWINHVTLTGLLALLAGFAILLTVARQPSRETPSPTIPARTQSAT